MVLLHSHYICDYCFKDIPWYFCILIIFVFTVLMIYHGIDTYVNDIVFSPALEDPMVV